MDDERIARALARWRDDTEGVKAPRGLADAVERAALGSGVSGALWSLGRPVLVAGAIAAAAAIALGVTSVRELARDAAAYALSGGP